MMKQTKYAKRYLLQALAITAFLSNSCGAISTGASPVTKCATGTAQIQIRDGSLTRVCGCTEAAGSVFSDGSSLQCTLPVGTQMYFQFVSISQSHQISIVGIGSTSYFSSSSSITQTSVIPLSASGTYTFSDLYEPGLSGTLIIQ